MNAAELREIIAQGEDSYTEFKEESAHPDDLAAAIVAFANTEGGRQASRQELLRLYQAALALFPDELPVPNTTLSDLDQGYFERQFETFAEMPVEDTGLSLERLLSNLKLWDGTTLTVAGLLLFGRNPQAHLPFAMVNAVHFKGTEVGEEFLDRKEILGTLEDQITDAEAWLRLRLPVAGKISGFRREDTPETPSFVLREAVV